MALDTSNTGSLRIRSDELPSGAMRYFYNGVDNDSAGRKLVIAAPGAGRRLVLTHLTMSTSAAQSISINNGDVDTAFIGPIQLEAAGVNYIKDYIWGIELTENTPMYVKSDTDAQFQIYIEYMNVPA